MIFYKSNFTASLFCLAIFWNTALRCQPLIEQRAYGPLLERYETIQQNSVSSLEANGDAVWMAPGLNAFFENIGEIYVPQNADSVFSGRGRVFSLALNGPHIVAGLGFTSTAGGDNVSAAQGYYQSFDNGLSWRFLPFPLDSRPNEDATCDGNSVGPPCDLEFTYGGNRYNRIRITVPEQSPPFEVDFINDTILSVNWASGLLRSTDSGITWERLILPPSYEYELAPDNSYQWLSRTASGETINRYDPRFDNNLLGFGLLIDKNERVWVGTAAGINISENALTAPSDQIIWRKISFDPENVSGLLSNWIIKVRQQPGTDRIWMTNWRADPQNRDEFGLVYTEDGANTFHRFLEGERINDVGFFEGSIFAAGDNGLFISDDDGKSWRNMGQIRSANTFISQNSRYFAVAATESHLWVGTSDGIASTNDGGGTWRIIRTDVPLSGGNIYQPDAPNVTTYAYPNPFSPARHSLVRIKYEMKEPGAANFRIFDFSMSPVRTIHISPVPVNGAYEITWDGTNESGRIVASGTYFYTIDTPSGAVNGKILLLD
jgi:hypothetical protein